MHRLYQIMSATQLNEAEYAGPFAAALLYLAATGATEPSAAATIAVFGQIGYYWPVKPLQSHRHSIKRIKDPGSVPRTNPKPGVRGTTTSASAVSKCG